MLPGTPTYVELVTQHRADYENALDEADEASLSGEVNVSAMERLIESLLAKQLANVYQMAGGKLQTSTNGTSD